MWFVWVGGGTDEKHTIVVDQCHLVVAHQPGPWSAAAGSSILCAGPWAKEPDEGWHAYPYILREKGQQW